VKHRLQDLEAAGLLTLSDVARATDAIEAKLASITAQNATLRRRLDDLETPKAKKRLFGR